MNVSPDFSPPLRFTAPYFVIGVICNFASMLMLFGLDAVPQTADLHTVGWVHLYMLGFVMMNIFGAMSQLAPVIGEVDHAHVGLFRWIWPLLLMGTLLLTFGFYVDTLWLPWGTLGVISALLLFITNLLLTLRKTRRKTSVMQAMKVSNLFLLLGILIGGIMASAYAGVIDIDPRLWLKPHLFLVFGGYIMLTVMGVSTVLLPMFGSCSRINENSYAKSFYSMMGAIAVMLSGSLLQLAWLEGVALILAFISLLLYLFEVYAIFMTRQRPQWGIWERSVAAAFVSLILAWGIGIAYLFSGYEPLLVMSMWLVMAGFIGLLISGHLYRIVPFLVWFERYAPYVGEKEVPLLHEMLPVRLANMQFTFAAVGILITTVALAFGHDQLFYGGVSMLVVASLTLLVIVVKVLRTPAK